MKTHQIQNIVQNSEIFTRVIYYSVQHHSINQSYLVILKLENQ